MSNTPGQPLPTVQVLRAGESDTSPTPQSDGVIDPAVTQEETELVFDMLEGLDAPSAEDLLQQEQEAAERAPQDHVLEQQQQPDQQVQQTAQSEPQGQQPAQATPPVQVEQPGVQAGQQAPGATGQQPNPQAAGPSGQELTNLHKALEQQREKYIEVAASAYEATFSDEDIAEFQTGDTKKALSRMAATLHADIAQNVLGMVAQTIPQVVYGLTQAQTVHKTAEDGFYNDHPDLAAHKEQVYKIAQSVRHYNPSMPADEFKKNIAIMARATLGLPANPVQVQQPPQQQQRAPVRQQGFQPVSSAPSRTASPQAQHNDNPWEFISEVVEAEDSGAFSA